VCARTYLCVFVCARTYCVYVCVYKFLFCAYFLVCVPAHVYVYLCVPAQLVCVFMFVHIFNLRVWFAHIFFVFVPVDMYFVCVCVYAGRCDCCVIGAGVGTIASCW